MVTIQVPSTGETNLVINTMKLILLSNKREVTTDTHNNMHESQMRNAKCKKARLTGYILYDSLI